MRCKICIIFLEPLVVKVEKVLDNKFNKLVAGDSWKFLFELYKAMGQYSSFNMFLSFRFPLALSRKRIGLKSMLGVYLVLITGLFIAFVTLLVERYWYKKKLTESIVNKLVIRLWINSNT